MTLLNWIASRRVAAILFGAFMVTAALPVSQGRACACCGSYKVVGSQVGTLSTSGPDLEQAAGLFGDWRRAKAASSRLDERRGNWVRIQTGNGYEWVNRMFLAIIR